MAKARLTNLTNNNFSFEATVLSLQGQHLTVRQVIPAGGSVDVELPAGVTLDMLAAVPSVKNELALPSPRYSIAALADDKAAAFAAGGESLKLAVSGVAGSVVPVVIGTASKAGKLVRIRVIWKGAPDVGESIDVDQLSINGVAVVFNSPILVEGPLPGYSYMDFDAQAIGPVVFGDGAIFELGYTYAGGPGLTDVSVDLLLAL